MPVRFNFLTRLTIAITLVALAGVVAIGAVRRFNAYGVKVDSDIGWLQDVSGAVQIKSGDTDFRPAKTSTVLADGDQIVTGPDSKATINFRSGRTAECGKNTRITVSSLEDATQSPTILIDATRAGETAVKLKDNNAKPVILLTGSGAFTVSAGQSIVTKKSIATGAAEVFKTDTKTGQTVNLTKVEPAQTTQMVKEVLAAVIAATPTPTPVPTPKPKPKIDASASLISPVKGSEFWTTSDWSTIAASEIPLAVTIKSNVALTRAVLELKSVKGGSPIRMPLVASAKPEAFTAKVTVADLIRNSSADVVRGADSREFSVSIIGGDGESAKRIAVDGGFTITSVSPLGQAVSASIGFDSLTGEGTAGPWIGGTTGREPDKLPIVVITASAGMARRFLPVIRTASRSGFSTPASLGTQGTFVVKNQEIIAQLRGPSINNEMSDKLRQVLDGDFVFTGPQDALISAKKYSVDEIQKIVAASIESGKGIYVFQDESLFQVNADFVRKHPSVASFVRRNSSAFFTKKVNINSFR